MADVTVIIPCYNGRAFIGQTLRSVLDQTDVPRQIIVIDDGSTDGSADVIREFPVELVQQENAGESRARNVGIGRAECEYVAFLDADDVWLPEKIERQIALLANLPGVGVGAHCPVFNFHDELDDSDREVTERTKDDPNLEDLVDYHYVTPSSLVVRRSVLIDHDIRFDEKVHHSEDMLFIADLRLVGSLHLLDEPLVGKRIHATQQSRNVWHPIWSLQSRVNWLRARRDAIGAARADAMEAELADRMIEVLEDRYWRRQVDGFREARAIVAELFPDRVARHNVINRAIMPKWLYSLRDKLTA